MVLMMQNSILKLDTSLMKMVEAYMKMNSSNKRNFQ